MKKNQISVTPKKLSKEEITQKMMSLNGEWQLTKTGFLIRVVPFDSFDSAIDFINKMANLASKSNHHPDFSFSKGMLQISLITHKIGALTEKDFEFAQELDQLISWD